MQVNVERTVFSPCLSWYSVDSLPDCGRCIRCRGLWYGIVMYGFASVIFLPFHFFNIKNMFLSLALCSLTARHLFLILFFDHVLTVLVSYVTMFRAAGRFVRK